MSKCLRAALIVFLFLGSFDFGGQEGLSQAPVPSEKDLPVKIGSIDFRIREIEATPAPIRMLEMQIEIINQSNKVTVPPNAVKVVAIPKAVQFSTGGPASSFTPPPGEVTLTSPLPPRSGRIGIIGFSLPREKLESISFEIQINPPDGEKKTATFNF